ncbi:hypothetical protein, partial [Bacillus sp. WP8]|uniref:hypothetical protein n=1 Tax=Bacillus sp. WP8 TaxID=756828 RepID=UPI001C92DC75
MKKKVSGGERGGRDNKRCVCEMVCFCLVDWRSNMKWEIWDLMVRNVKRVFLVERGGDTKRGV